MNPTIHAPCPKVTLDSALLRLQEGDSSGRQRNFHIGCQRARWPLSPPPSPTHAWERGQMAAMDSLVPWSTLVDLWLKRSDSNTFTIDFGEYR